MTCVPLSSHPIVLVSRVSLIIATGYLGCWGRDLPYNISDAIHPDIDLFITPNFVVPLVLWCMGLNVNAKKEVPSCKYHQTSEKANLIGHIWRIGCSGKHARRDTSRGKNERQGCNRLSRWTFLNLDATPDFLTLSKFLSVSKGLHILRVVGECGSIRI